MKGTDYAVCWCNRTEQGWKYEVRTMGMRGFNFASRWERYQSPMQAYRAAQRAISPLGWQIESAYWQDPQWRDGRAFQFVSDGKPCPAEEA